MTSNNPDSSKRARYSTSPATSNSGGLSGKIAAILLVVLLAAVVIFVARYLANRQEDSVTASMTNYERIDASTLRMDVDVTRSTPDVPAYCIVVAIDYDHAEVGRREIPLPAGGENPQRITVDIPTRGDAVTGNVYGCSTTIPSYLDVSGSK